MLPLRSPFVVTKNFVKKLGGTKRFRVPKKTKGRLLVFCCDVKVKKTYREYPLPPVRTLVFRLEDCKKSRPLRKQILQKSAKHVN